MALFRKKSGEPDSSQQLAEELAELREVLRHYPPGSALSFGSPSRCPECGDFGMVGHVGHEAGVCSNHCLRCRRDWTVTVRALRAHKTAMRTPTGTRQQGVLLSPIEPSTPAVPQPVVAPPPPAPPAATPPVVAEAPTPPATSAPAPIPPESLPPASPPVIELEGDAPPTEPPANVVAVAPRPAPGDRLRILVVEDNPFDFAAIEELLEPETNPAVELVHVVTRREAEAAMRSDTFDLVLLDLDLPDSTGLTTVLEWQHAVSEPVPLITLTDDGDVELIAGARALGAVQAIQKPHLEKLVEQRDKGRRRFLTLLQAAAKQAPVKTIESL